MAVVGSIRAGLFADGQILIAKAVIDGIMALVMASSLGIGVALSAFSVQFHPEACSGPKDTSFLFDEFTALMRNRKGGK